MELARRCSSERRSWAGGQEMTYRSHLSLLFLQGSQLIALRALLGGGRTSGVALSAESETPFAPGDRTRTCVVLEADPEPEPDAVSVDR